jgi:dCMP deaminase
VEKLNQEKKVYQRPTWDEYFLRLMEVIGERGTCDRGRSGAVIVKDRCLVATGYVGSPAGMPHCDEVGHQLKQTVHEDGHISTHCVRTIHAEQNAILQAAKNGVPLEGTTLYCRMEPCPVCAKMIVNAGIKRVVSWNKYHGADETQSLFKQCGVKLDIVNNQFEKYENQ